MCANYGCDRECKGAGIPLQHHLGLLPTLGGACINSMGLDKKLHVGSIHRHIYRKLDVQLPIRPVLKIVPDHSIICA